MIGIVIVTHGRLAAELLAAAEKIAGRQTHFRAVSLEWSQGLEESRRRIKAAVRELDDSSGVLILTDMFGDTPSNAAHALRQPGRVELISGVNLPMVVRLACSSTTDRSLDELARWLEVKGRRSIRRAGAVEQDPLPGEGDAGG